MLSTLDTLAWRYGVPESVYPEALIPGMREVGGLLSANMWGSIYPRSGFIHQVDDFKAGAVIAQRAGDITTRVEEPHVYLPMRSLQEPGYWPAGEQKEGDASTGKWQQLTPVMSPTCATFPTSPSLIPNDALLDCKALYIYTVQQQVRQIHARSVCLQHSHGNNLTKKDF